jgi:hypothetical protein
MELQRRTPYPPCEEGIKKGEKNRDCDDSYIHEVFTVLLQ